MSGLHAPSNHGDSISQLYAVRTRAAGEGHLCHLTIPAMTSGAVVNVVQELDLFSRSLVLDVSTLDKS